MKKIASKKKYAIVAGVAVLAVSLAGVLGRDLQQQSYRQQIKTTLLAEIEPFKDILGQMGFDTKNITTSCVEDIEPSADLQCTASINSYLVVGNEPDKLAKLKEQSVELSEHLSANGWKQRPDLPTVKWFEEISKGVDYQPDQLNHKQVGDMTCVIDFFTAFSKPAPVAINLRADCYKPKLPEFDEDNSPLPMLKVKDYTNPGGISCTALTPACGYCPGDVREGACYLTQTEFDAYKKLYPDLQAE